MSKSRNRKRTASKPTPPPATRQFPRTSAVVIAVLLVGAVVFWWSRGRQTVSPPAAAETTAVEPTNQPASATTPNPVFEKLKGKWLRPDGGYLVEVRGVEPGGKMDVGYFNPKPIHVFKAEASQEGTVTKVFIELRDVNYPGSTYNLVYEADKDQLSGIYFQAALQQRFEVVFVRAQ
jgi:hypothetical protein